jgi:hypothetical protein
MEFGSSEFEGSNRELLASDEAISELVHFVDDFPYIFHRRPEGSVRHIGSGLVVSDKISCAIFQSTTYRYLTYRYQSQSKCYELINMDQYVGMFDGPAGMTGTIDADEETIRLLRDGGSNSDDPLERLEFDLRKEEVTEYLAGLAIAYGAVKPNESLSVEQAEQFNTRHPFYAHYSGMALTDVVLTEYKSGFPVFYGIVPRPDARVIEDLTLCFKEGEIRHGNGIERIDEWEKY